MNSEEVNAHLNNCYLTALNWIMQEGWLRMTEHLIVLIVVIRVLKQALTIESRGKVGLFSYVTKLFLRLTDKLSFVKNKKQQYL